MARLKEHRRIINQAKSKKPSRCFLSTPGTPAAAARRPPWSAGWNPRAAPSPASSLPQLDPPAQTPQGKLPFTQVVPLRSWAPRRTKIPEPATPPPARTRRAGGSRGSRHVKLAELDQTARDGDSAPWASRLGGGERGARRGLLGGSGEDRSGVNGWCLLWDPGGARWEERNNFGALNSLNWRLKC
jgi:hypothetical protein